MKKTKIVATISDLRCSVEFLRPLVEAGVNVVRMNTAHMTPEGITEVINNTRAVSKDVAVLLDTKGPEVRTTVLSGNSEYKAQHGRTSRLSSSQVTRLHSWLTLMQSLTTTQSM